MIKSIKYKLKSIDDIMNEYKKNEEYFEYLFENNINE
jgi:hypothetical protein